VSTTHSDRMPATAAIGYITSRFPHFSETFIVREMDAVEALGHRVTVYPLLRQRQRVVHPVARRWVDAARWSNGAGRVWRANVRAFSWQPTAYSAMWWTVLLAHSRAPSAGLRALVVVPKAVLIAELMRRDRIEHVHAHYATHPALAAWVIHRLNGTPYTVTVHAHDIFLGGAMVDGKLGAARGVVAISDFNGRRVAELTRGQLRARTSTIHCGVDPTRYARPRVPRLPGEPWHLLCIGSLQEYKGHTHLIAALGLLRASGVDARLRIVGDGRLRRPLLAQIGRAGLDRCVELPGVLDEDAVAELLRASDCYVQPSVIARSGQMEGIPVALMEAMASGVPVVATDLSGVPELVQPGATGWVVPAADPAALARALHEVATRPDLVATRCARAKELIAREFDVHDNARRLSLLFGAAEIRHLHGVPS
jgi:colanic acid/amylovoran biosynthesis glycosyltransferase